MVIHRLKKTTLTGKDQLPAAVPFPEVTITIEGAQPGTFNILANKVSHTNMYIQTVKKSIFALALILLGIHSQAQKKSPVDYVNPLLGTATLLDSVDIGYRPTHRTWGAEVFPGSSMPNAMVQLSPVTQFRSGSGYQYEDKVIYGFIHTSKGHWNLGNIPLMPATGTFTADDYKSPFSHSNESAHPGYYQVYLERYGINAELTSTLRSAFGHGLAARLRIGD